MKNSTAGFFVIYPAVSFLCAALSIDISGCSSRTLEAIPFNDWSISFALLWKLILLAFLLAGLSAACCFTSPGLSAQDCLNAVYIFAGQLLSLLINLIIIFDFGNYMLSIMWLFFICMMALDSADFMKKTSLAAALFQVLFFLLNLGFLALMTTIFL